MGYKDFSDSYSFVYDLEHTCRKADLAVGKSLEQSRSLKRMEQIKKAPRGEQVNYMAFGLNRLDRRDRPNRPALCRAVKVLRVT